jgi:hypothetical protein
VGGGDGSGELELRNAPDDLKSKRTLYLLIYEPKSAKCALLLEIIMSVAFLSLSC